MKLKIVAVTAAALALPTIGHAAEFAGFTVGGYIDVSTQVNDYDDSTSIGFTNTGASVLGLSAADGDISLNQLALRLVKTPDTGFGAVVGVVMGDSVVAIAPNSAYINAAGAFPNIGEVAVSEGYVQYAGGNFAVMAGKFFTLAGYEVFNSTGNAQATRGLVYNLQPLSLTGVRGSVRLWDAFTVTAGAVNEVSGSTIDFADDQKAYELQLAWATDGGPSVALTHYMTSEGKALDESLPSALTDLVFGYNFGAVTLALNYDLLTFEDAADTETSGLALYAGFAITDSINVSGRYEMVKTEADGSPDADSQSITLTGGFALSKEFDLIAELRSDTRDDSTDFDGDDTGNMAAIKGIYKF